MTNEFLTVTDAARILGMSSDSVRYHERRGHLNAIRIARQRIFFRQDIERFKRQRAEEDQDAQMEKVNASVVPA